MKSRFIRALSVGFVLTIAALGCGKMKESAEKNRSMNAVKALSIDYKKHQDFVGAPPTSADHLTEVAKNRGEKLNLLPDEIGKLKVQWGAKLDPTGKDAGILVLASMPPVGGEVAILMLDGSVKTMSEADFEKAKKAEVTKDEPAGKDDPAKKPKE